MTIVRKFDTGQINSQEQSKFDWKSKKITLLSFFAVVALAVLQIWANNTLVSFGEKYESVSQLYETLEIENKVLENKIAKFSSINNIASQSAILGLSRPKDLQYLP